MKKYIFLGWGLLVMSIWTCNNPETSQVEISSKVKADEQSTTPVLFLKAVGNEPGWHIQMTAANDGTFPFVLVLDYGADTLIGNLNKNPIMEASSDGQGRPTVGSNEAKYSGVIQDSEGKPTIEILIQSSGCTDDADKRHGASVEVKLEDQTLRGCGDYYE
jgi:uncharacterized membrane protein